MNSKEKIIQQAVRYAIFCWLQSLEGERMDLEKRMIAAGLLRC